MKDVNFKSEIVIQNRLKTQEKGAQKGAGNKGKLMCNVLWMYL